MAKRAKSLISAHIPSTLSKDGGAFVDIRGPIGFDELNRLLLAMAEKPLSFTGELALTEANYPGAETLFAAQLARQACASVVSNCVMMIWSEAVACLHALEPDFPLYPKSVKKFVTDTRLPFQSYVSLVYHICGNEYAGTDTQNKITVITDIRHELEHDKPESYDEHSKERVDALLKWHTRLIPFIGKEGLLWQPSIRPDGRVLGMTIGGEPIIMKFMKYPVAKWVTDSTKKITNEISDMMMRHQGKKLVTERRPMDERYHGEKANELVRRLWEAGK